MKFYISIPHACVGIPIGMAIGLILMASSDMQITVGTVIALALALVIAILIAGIRRTK